MTSAPRRSNGAGSLCDSESPAASSSANDKHTSFVDGKIQQRALVQLHQNKVAASVMGPTLQGLAPYGLNKLGKLGVGVWMISGASGRTQAVEPYLAGRRLG